jgi:hypothetical protein
MGRSSSRCGRGHTTGGCPCCPAVPDKTPTCRSQALPGLPAPTGPARLPLPFVSGWAVPSTAGAERTAGSRVPSPVGELARPPTGAGQRSAGAADTRPKSVPPAASGRGQAVPDPPARQGRQTDAEGCGGAATIAGRGGRQRTPGAEAPGSVRKPPEGGCAAPRRPGRSAGCRRRVDQPASAGLGTEPGRSRPGDRGEGRSADRRCVSGETCRPRSIAAPVARRARRRLAPTRWDDPSPIGAEASP